jgi:glucans biosynthesis protein
MSDNPDRRTVLKTLAGATAAAGIAGPAVADGLNLAPPEPFSFDILKQIAKDLAGKPYKGPGRPSPEILAKIDYDAWGKIKFNTDHAIFANGPGRFPITFFHLGMFFQKAVEMYVVEDGQSRLVIYDQSYFDMPADSVARQLPKGAGFAGFRYQEARDGKLDWHKNDWAAFLGAAFFRSIGELFQYGISARAVALDVAVADRDEEFPDFTRFYFGPEDGDTVTLYALVEGPGIVGACKFLMTRGQGVVMDIEQVLHLRKDYVRFGIAPLTSMFWFSETVKLTGVDWRPEVHDSDGLAMWTGWGEHLWRPLNNPPRTMASAFGDENPKGFGLLQRDRIFDHYMDGVNYDKRPSLWVEPIGSWGKGSIQLVEIPTDDEIHDNIVAMWVPATPAKAGTETSLRYKMHWLADEPSPTPLARCVATRLGNGGQPGQPRPKGVRKFVVEFLGGPLTNLAFGEVPEASLWASRGIFTNYRITEAVADSVPGHWRTEFDLAGVTGTDPVEMRLQLKIGDKILTETWLFQYHPF